MCRLHWFLLLTLALMIQACTQAGPDRELELETIERMEAAARVMMNEEGRNRCKPSADCCLAGCLPELCR